MAPDPSFSAVPWLPPFRLDARLLFEGALEVTHAPDALRPFARLVPDPAAFRFHAPGEAAALDGMPEAALRERLGAIPPGDLSRPARARRWALATALAAAGANAALRRLGDGAAWTAAAAARRRAYLEAIDAGLPPPAAGVEAACREVPHALRGFGNALPTAEAIRLLAPFGRVCEIGAGFGLFARALERAGLAVAASDRDASPATGIAFPVRRGVDAAATMAFFAASPAPPPLLMVWPTCGEGEWFAEVFARARPGQVVAMASPEFEFCAAGGLAAEAPDPGAPGAGWRAAAALPALLDAEYEPVGTAPVVTSGWPAAPTPLRAWRRRGAA
ncbi:hypothetical protein [Falsiroseomonas sp. CW058]|uniref:hypothetical protein n=1 Tax=Falsiroseomonas sp. CW058 TaxID=3388664 RepID=UPI003D31177A